MEKLKKKNNETGFNDSKKYDSIWFKEIKLINIIKTSIIKSIFVQERKCPTIEPSYPTWLHDIVHVSR